MVGVGAYGTYHNQPTEVMNVERTATTTDVVVEEWMTDQDAVQAAKDVIKKKELEALEAQLVAEITSKQEELDEVRKEIGTY